MVGGDGQVTAKRQQLPAAVALVATSADRMAFGALYSSGLRVVDKFLVFPEFGTKSCALQDGLSKSAFAPSVSEDSQLWENHGIHRPDLATRARKPWRLRGDPSRPRKNIRFGNLEHGFTVERCIVVLALFGDEKSIRCGHRNQCLAALFCCRLFVLLYALLCRGRIT